MRCRRSMSACIWPRSPARVMAQRRSSRSTSSVPGAAPMHCHTCRGGRRGQRGLHPSPATQYHSDTTCCNVVLMRAVHLVRDFSREVHTEPQIPVPRFDTSMSRLGRTPCSDSLPPGAAGASSSPPPSPPSAASARSSARSASRCRMTPLARWTRVALSLRLVAPGCVPPIQMIAMNHSKCPNGSSE